MKKQKVETVMSKYDKLDARKELEQTMTNDLHKAFSKRGFKAKHNGTSTSHAVGGMADIEVFNEKYHFTVEVTKSTKSQQDREFNPIKEHLQDIKDKYPTKKAFCIYVSPSTPKRMSNSIKEYNQQNDEKIIPIDFETFQTWITKLIEADSSLYGIEHLIETLSKYDGFIDDLRTKKLLFKSYFANDEEIKEQLKKEEVEKDQKSLEELIKDLSNVENYMRQNGIAVSQNAIDSLIFIVFIKLFEEKQKTDRLSNKESFIAYTKNLGSRDRKEKRAIHKLFEIIKEDEEFENTGMFTENDSLPDTITDDFILEYIIPKFEKYNFIGTTIDALGAVYEVLALRADKDVKVGQFFTPENVVNFMVDMANLNHKDKILDPACGTGRFLIHSMKRMFDEVENSTSPQSKKEKDIEHISKYQLYGSDIDLRIAKIAKMNMWIHGDGKSNIFGGRDYNGLTLYNHTLPTGDSFDNNFDAILTNPPLGDLNYQTLDFGKDKIIAKDDEEREKKYQELKLKRMPFLPVKNETETKLNEINKKVDSYKAELKELENKLTILELSDSVISYLKLIESNKTKANKLKKDSEEVATYTKLISKINQKNKTIDSNIEKSKDLEALIRTDQCKLSITGNNLKGGSQFLGAIWHYLKDDAGQSDLAEWRGGKTLIVLDEGVLNTDDYSKTREFIKSHFFIKAVVSLTRDTFIPISNTNVKTSIMYLIKKSDIHTVQKEPIFFAHVNSVGMDTKGKIIKNDLPDILHNYREFAKNILDSYNGGVFNKNTFLSLQPKG